MKKAVSRSKNKATVVTLFLMLTLVVAAIPAVDARDEQTYAFVSAEPDPVGVGQTVVITMIVHPFPPTDNDVYHDFELTITKPDATTQTVGPIDSDPTGSTFAFFVPQDVGTYTVQFTYPGEYFESTDINRLGDTSEAMTFTAQAEKVPAWPESPLPTDYWERPISAEHRSWSAISGDWLMGCSTTDGRIYGTNNGFNPYTQAPRSAHVMWTKPLRVGGLVGGFLGEVSYDPGLIYEAMLTPPVIMGGILYYRLYKSSSGNPGRYGGFAAVDLRTGKELFTVEDGTIHCGQTYLALGVNGQGVQSFLWDLSSDGAYTMYDAFTGEKRAVFEGSLGGTNNIVYGDLGELYTYYITGPRTDRVLTMWNSSLMWENIGWFSGGSLRGDRVGTYNWSLGMQYQKPVETAPDEFGSVGLNRIDTTTKTIWASADDAVAANNGHQYHYGYDCYTGDKLWEAERQFLGGRSSRISVGEGTYTHYNPGTLRYSTFNITTGEWLWDSDPNDPPWGAYTCNGVHAYGNVYHASYDGHARAFDGETGKQIWEVFSGESGIETPFGIWPMFGGPIVGGHTVFVNTDEHTPSSPLYRGESLFAIDAFDGTLLWMMPQYIGVKALADGYLVGWNAYTSEIWVIGKGPSATTVTAPDTAVPLGTSVVIRGTVTDQSEGQKGTPAIADVDQPAWQVYLHAQGPVPADIKGVPVSLSAVGPDGNVINIGDVMSDMSGTFAKMWEPPAEGLYTIYATFLGTDSYGSSYAETTLGVTARASEPEEEPAYTAIDLAIIAAVVVAIVIGIVNLWALRKRK